MYVKWLNYDFDVSGYYFEYGSVTSRIFRKYYVRPTNQSSNQQTFRGGHRDLTLPKKINSVCLCVFFVWVCLLFFCVQVYVNVCVTTHTIFFFFEKSI